MALTPEEIEEARKNAEAAAAAVGGTDDDDDVDDDFAHSAARKGFNEIAERSDRDQEAEANESLPTADEDGNITPVAAESEHTEDEPGKAATLEGDVVVTSSGDDASTVDSGTPQLQAIDPEKMYKVKVEGVEMEVPGSKIIDAGFRTYQKETAADAKLQIASRLQKQAEDNLRASTTTAKPDEAPPKDAPKGENLAEIAKALQYGTAEEGVAAIEKLQSMGRSVDPADITKFVTQQIPAIVADNLAFERGKEYVDTEYRDLMENPSVRMLFFMEEERVRSAGDNRSYIEVYKTVGEKIRKELNRPKPSAKTTLPKNETRLEKKQTTPGVPTLASSRLNAGAAPDKDETHTDILAGMRKSRKQTTESEL